MGVIVRDREFDADHESGTRTRALKEVVYIGRDHAFGATLTEQCRPHGIIVRIATLARDATRLFETQRIGVFVVDLSERDLVPPNLLREIQRSAGVAPEGAVRVVVSRSKRGASVVGFSPTETRLTCHRVLKAAREQSEQVALRDILIGESEAIEGVRQQIADVAMFSDVSVLVLGETGTGKELVATALHRVGAAPDKPFVAINCAAIPEPLIESELFGHEAGTFTGAKEGRVGLLEEAGRGTVFLDEIGEMPGLLQPKLLRALDQRTIRRIGSNRETAFGARVVSATNRPVEELAGLRSDLFYRLAGFVIELPPLRHRREDVPILARVFAEEFAHSHGLPIPDLSADALAAMTTHRWPGNVRELKVVVQRSVILARGGLVTRPMIERGLHVARPKRRASSKPPASVQLSNIRPGPTPAYGVGDGRNLRQLERDVILRALEANGGNVARTARQLGIPRSTLRARLRSYDASSL